MKNDICRIFIIGQCSLHWGRMEFGNIGNYYIIKPFFSELRRVFPSAEIVTTMQFSEDFCSIFHIESVPMEIYYDFNREDNLRVVKEELESLCNNEQIKSEYIEEVKKSDLVIDFSGDIWGDNAEFLGPDRFAVGCYRDIIAQKLVPTVMISGSPGPFELNSNLELAKVAYAGFTLVVNREPLSTRLLYELGFDLTRTKDFPCPSFLFEAQPTKQMKNEYDVIYSCNDTKVGMILCGWNFEKGPFDLWPRDDSEYETFAAICKYIIDYYNATIVLMSHSNGFTRTENEFELIKGRDFPIVEKLYGILCEEGYQDKVILITEPLLPDETKNIISQFDILISGRMHGAVAGLSQNIPTIIIDYGHHPKAHKLRGFSEVVSIGDIIANPNDLEDLIKKIDYCFENKNSISKKLAKRMAEIKKLSKIQFEILKNYLL